MTGFNDDVDLQYQVNRLYDKLADPDSTLPVELKAAVHQELEEVDGLLERHTAADGHLEFALDYISWEAEKWRMDDNELGEDEDPREDPPCTCGDRWCEYKWGRLTKRAREADSLDEAVRVESRNHDGRPNVLFEVRREWNDEHGMLMGVVRKNRIALVNKVHPAKLEEWGSMSPGDLSDVIDGNGRGVAD